MNKKYSTLLLGISLLIGMYFLSQWYIDINRDASEEFRFLFYAISTGIIALGLHFIRYVPAMKNSPSILLMVDSFELLLLIMTPILSIFQVFFKEYPEPMFILITAGIFLWWMVVVIRTNNASGKLAFSLSANMYAGLLAIVGIVALFLTLRS